MKIKNRLNYILVLKYLCFSLLLVIFSFIKKSPTVYSVGVFSSAVALGFNPFSSAVFLVLCAVLIGGENLAVYFLAPALLFIILWGAYKLKKRKMGIEVVIFTLLSLVYFVVAEKNLTLAEKITDAVISSLISLVLFIGGRGIGKKGLRYKLGYEEVFTIFVAVALTGLGISNLVSPHLWKGISVLFILVLSFIYKTGKCALISAVLGLSLSIYYSNISYLSQYLLLAVAVESVMPVSRFLSAIVVVAIDYAVYAVFGIFGDYTVFNAIAVCSASAVFSLIPIRHLLSVKNKMSLFKQQQLSRLSINRNRLMTSNRLYDLSAVFLEIADCFSSLNTAQGLESSSAKKITATVINTVCAECKNRERCMDLSMRKADLNKTVEIGVAKGKISFIDFPSGLSSTCIRASDLIYAVNKLIANSLHTADQKKSVEEGRRILSGGANGVAEILKSLAFECGTQLKYLSDAEKELSEKLYRLGYKVSEVLVYGDISDKTVSMIVTDFELSLPAIKKVVEGVLKTSLFLAEKCFVTEDKCYIKFTASAKYDAVFGVSSIRKDGSKTSGDTHSATRIRGDKFLIALSDGMGSGEHAQKVSSTSLSLIESFYKAGLSSPFILSTVNKLLATSTEDTFTALDIAVVDLKNCSADFIKLGAPYGFIISDNSVRIVEGSSLPLGILDDLSPSVVKTDLNDGDILLMVTDGVSDAFGSSADILEFLRTLALKNPQTLADETLKKALEKTGGKRFDDMTVLAVRIFEKELDYA